MQVKALTFGFDSLNITFEYPLYVNFSCGNFYSYTYQTNYLTNQTYVEQLIFAFTMFFSQSTFDYSEFVFHYHNLNDI
jgi:hypothetical protein